ncbi:hypothetical protein [Methanoregula sp.]|uniref:hypothetical protein n=1 Tax=Methanoregula sp. TaxID=2052170 RepID=UPI002BF1F724|nr:hypothetical protein [Methanoregula sp.]HVP95603.1 hypothetical protein [Methanoregula sp.]
METLENKLDRLSAEQRREVEDFVDFLIQRVEGIRVTVQLPSHDQPPAKSIAPPLITPDPAPAEDPAVPLPREEVIAAAPEPVHEAEAPVAIHEIETDDGLLDYGKFEKAPAPASPFPPSPADAAVQKVKRKLIQKSEQASKNQLLDWID